MRAKSKAGLFGAGLITAILMSILIFGSSQKAVAYEYQGHHHPQPGEYVSFLPRNYCKVVHNGMRYYIANGIWLRPYGARFVVVSPPTGFVVPLLPSNSEMVQINGYPLYYSDEVYYIRVPNGFKILKSPSNFSSLE
jgi:hypothetical protein